MVSVDLMVDLDDKRTGCIDDFQAASPGFFPHFLGDAVGTENDDRAIRRLMEFFHKHGPFLAQRVDDMTAMDDLVTHIDRRAVSLERQLHDLDRAIHTGAEPPRIGEIDLHALTVRSVCNDRRVGALGTAHHTSEDRLPSTALASALASSETKYSASLTDALMASPCQQAPTQALIAAAQRGHK